MQVQRVFAPGGVTDGTISIDRDEAHHAIRVRRLAVGDVVIAFDGQGHSWRCRISGIGKSGAWLEVIENREPGISRPGPEIVLGTAVPKGDRFEWIVEKATELGVSRLVPLVCGRSVVEPRPAKLERLRRTVIEACKQSGRDRLMEISEPVDLGSFLAELPGRAAGLIADWGPVSLAEAAGHFPEPESVRVCIGPEGGWKDEERAMAARFGWRSIGLGPHILRVETAAIAAAAVIWQRFCHVSLRMDDPRTS